MNIAVRKTQFVRVLKERLFLRFHMSLILIGPALVGLPASKLLLLKLHGKKYGPIGSSGCIDHARVS